MAKAVARAKSIQEYLSHFADEAHYHAAKNIIPAFSYAEVISIVTSAFWMEWLANMMSSRPTMRFPHPQHHCLDVWISTPTPSHILSIVELALYLKNLHDVEGLGEVIENMRAIDQFETSLLQVAFAHRFKQAGASALKFEPTLNSGRRADLYFKIDKEPYLVECFKRGADGHPWDSDIKTHTWKRLLKHAKYENKSVLITLKVNYQCPLSDKERIEIEIAGRRLISKIMPAEVLFVEMPNSTLTVEDVSQISETERNSKIANLRSQYEFGVNEFITNRNELPRITRGESFSSKGTSSFFLDVQERKRDFTTYLEGLVNKVEQKIAQCRMGKEHSNGIIIVETGFARPNDDKFQKLAKRLYDKILNSHPSIAAVFGVDRVFDTNHRPHYAGMLLHRHTDKNLTQMAAKIRDYERQELHL